MKESRFPAWPHFEQDEIDAATRVLASGKVNYWTGAECKLFEEEFAAYVGRKHAISLANGTLALELALRAFGIGPGDEVIVPARTFIATASSAVAVGAIPVIADVDPMSGNITAESAASLVGPRTKAIIAVHLGGWPCDMDPILELAGARGLKVIEDCAQAHGASYKGRPVGSLGDAAAFSFCQDKIMTTGGEGGMLVLDDGDAWSMAWAYKDHGKSYQAVHQREHAPGFRWLHESFGSNWRMTEMQAAIGRVQLRKLPRWVAKRRANAARLTDGLRSVRGLVIAQPSPAFGHSYYKFYAYLQTQILRPGWDQVRIMCEIEARGIPCFLGSCSEIYRERAFVTNGLGPTTPLPVAQALGKRSLMFLVHPTLGDDHIAKTCTVVQEVLSEAVI